MTTEFDGRIALVTAAAGAGIGQATARRLAAGGARVVVTDIHERRTREVAAAIAADHPASTVVGYPMDAGDRAQIDDVVAEVTRTLGRVQILVNNAAVNVIGSIFDYDPEHWDWCVRVNLSGPWYLCRAVMPLMRDAGSGVIVNVSSYAPDVGGAGIEAPYAITKGGLNVLTRSCAHEGGPFGIRAVTVATGIVTGTKFIDDHPEILDGPGARGPLGTFATADSVAEAIAFVASDRARHITGRDPQRRRRRVHAELRDRRACTRSGSRPPCPRPRRHSPTGTRNCDTSRTSVSPRSSPPTTSPVATRSSPMVALTAAAAATTRLRLQTGVLGNDYRHPVLVHRMAALLDVVSDGRLVLGLGAGWMTSDYEAAGIALDPAGRAGEPLRRGADRDQGPVRPRAVRLHRRALRRAGARRPPEAGAAPAPPALRRRREPTRPAPRGPRGRHRGDQRQPPRRRAGRARGARPVGRARRREDRLGA